MEMKINRPSSMRLSLLSNLWFSKIIFLTSVKVSGLKTIHHIAIYSKYRIFSTSTGKYPFDFLQDAVCGCFQEYTGENVAFVDGKWYYIV
jgi:hypothetical protein